MNLQDRYQNQIDNINSERTERERRYKEERELHLRIRPDFPSYCSRIVLLRKWFHKAYEARIQMGLEPWTHAYDYDYMGNVWLAKREFKAQGRYGADSDDIVFVPEDADFNVIGCDHTTIIDLRPEKLRDAMIIPAYSNTV